MEQRTQHFIDALRQLETTSDAQPIAALFADDADLSNPMVKHDAEGKAGAHAFWTRYRASFETISSEFKNIVEQGDVALLEWVSEGTIRGKAIRYGGVTVLEFGQAGIAAFRSYFDTAQLEIGL